jgi:hypothetical protein
MRAAFLGERIVGRDDHPFRGGDAIERRNAERGRNRERGHAALRRAGAAVRPRDDRHRAGGRLGRRVDDGDGGRRRRCVDRGRVEDAKGAHATRQQHVFEWLAAQERPGPARDLRRQIVEGIRRADREAFAEKP